MLERAGGKGKLNKIQKFEDLIVWKESVRLSDNIYKSLKNCKDFGLRDKNQRSSVSIPSNISEGFDQKGEVLLILSLHSLGSFKN
jgi:hypothetical protein